jgi:hypothetical protein
MSKFPVCLFGNCVKQAIEHTYLDADVPHPIRTGYYESCCSDAHKKQYEARIETIKEHVNAIKKYKKQGQKKPAQPPTTATESICIVCGTRIYGNGIKRMWCCSSPKCNQIASSKAISTDERKYFDDAQNCFNDFPSLLS